MSQKILIVDDQPKNLQVLAIILNEAGYKTVAALNGNMALKIVKKNQPDLILLDIMMPELDGYQVCEELKKDEKTKEIPVIFLTAKNEPEDIIKGFEIGAIDFITKPFNSAELLKRVDTHLKLMRYRNQLEQKNNKLLLLNSTKDRLFSIIAHDLRSPLGNFKAMLDMLVENSELFDDKQKENALNLLRNTANETFNLLENLLNWSRSQRNEIRINLGNIEINKLIEQTINLLKNNALSKEIEIVFIPDNNVNIVADENMIKTVLRNLLSNAIKFSYKKSKIIVSTKIVNNEKLETAIKDSGQGISLEAQKELFSINTKSTYGTDNEKGSGLGLVLCKEFVEKNGGEIFVKSEKQKGSTFFFSLPLYKP